MENKPPVNIITNPSQDDDLPVPVPIPVSERARSASLVSAPTYTRQVPVLPPALQPPSYIVPPDIPPLAPVIQSPRSPTLPPPPATPPPPSERAPTPVTPVRIPYEDSVPQQVVPTSVLSTAPSQIVDTDPSHFVQHTHRSHRYSPKPRRSISQKHQRREQDHSVTVPVSKLFGLCP